MAIISVRLQESASESEYFKPAVDFGMAIVACLVESPIAMVPYSFSCTLD